MDTNKIRDIVREQFEAKFPLPAGVAWKQSIGMYEVVDIWKLDKSMTIGRYNWLWEGWQASRETVVVDITWSTCLVPGGNPLEVIDACRDKVKAQGLKVTP